MALAEQALCVFYYLRYRLGGAQRVKSIGRHELCRILQCAKQSEGETRQVSLLVLIRLSKKPRCGNAEDVRREVTRYLARKRAAMKPRAFAEVAAASDAPCEATTSHAPWRDRPTHRRPTACGDRASKRPCCPQPSSIEPLRALLLGDPAEGFYLETNPVTGTAKEKRQRPRASAKPHRASRGMGCA